MVKTRNQIEAIVRTYVKEVEKDYRVTSAIVFGSYAQGTANEESDIDLAIISPDFKNYPEMELLKKLSRKTLFVDTSLEVLAFTPEELAAPDPRSLTYQIKTKGFAVTN